MSDETEEEQSHVGSFLNDLVRRFAYVFGLFFVVWMLLAKNIPSLFSPLPSKPIAERVTQEPVVPAPATRIPAKVEDIKPAAATEIKEEPKAPVATTETGGANVQNKPLEEQLAQLTSELSTVKKQLEERDEGTKKQSQSIEDKLAEQDKLIDALKEQIEQLQSSSTHQVSAVTAFSIMKQSALRGEAFENEFKQIQELIRDPAQNALLSLIRPFADTGIPTPAALQIQFDKTVSGALAPSSKDNTLAASLQSLIRIRKEGEQQQGQDDESVVARAEAKIQRGEIASVLKEMQALSPPMADKFAAWTKNARNTIAGYNALDALQIAILRNKEIPQEVAPSPVKSKAKPAAQPTPEAAKEPAQPAPETHTDTDALDIEKQLLPANISTPDTKPAITPTDKDSE